jgi:hypothetical protein
MRIKTIAGLAFAGAAVAAVTLAGGAYAADDSGSDQRVRIVYEDQGTAGTAADTRDCPEKNGGGSQPSPGESQPSESAL